MTTAHAGTWLAGSLNRTISGVVGGDLAAAAGDGRGVLRLARGRITVLDLATLHREAGE